MLLGHGQWRAVVQVGLDVFFLSVNAKATLAFTAASCNHD
jgi:hypothetical protein